MPHFELSQNWHEVGARKVDVRVSGSDRGGVDADRQEGIDTCESPRKQDPMLRYANLPGQTWTREIYAATPCQVIIAVLILATFLASMVEYQICPSEGTDWYEVLDGLGWFFNIIFTIELAVNIYSNLFIPFWLSGWNLFDLFVVVTAWIAEIFPKLPGMKVIRLFRAFRVFRLFKRIEALNTLLVGITQSIPPVSYAIVILFIIMGIWSIIGVEFFSKDFPDEFGNFGKAMLTMYQMATFDSWISGITRPICLYFSQHPYAVLFFVSYEFMASVIMLNVVIAILLGEFISAKEQVMEKAKAQREEEKERKKLEKWTKAAICMQGFVRKNRWHTACRWLLRQKRAAIKIQNCYRGFVVRKTLREPLRRMRQERMEKLQQAHISLLLGENQKVIKERQEKRRQAIAACKLRLEVLETRLKSWQGEVSAVVDSVVEASQKIGNQKAAKGKGAAGGLLPTGAPDGLVPAQGGGRACAGACCMIDVAMRCGGAAHPTTAGAAGWFVVQGSEEGETARTAAEADS